MNGIPYKKIIPIVLVALFLVSGGSALLNHTQQAGKPVLYGNAASISLPAKSVSFFIKNNLSVATPSSFDQRITVDSAMYSSYEASNLSNIYFIYANGTIVNSWLESGNSTSTGSIYWLNISTSIPSHSLLELYMEFMPTSSFMFNNRTTGEAPQLSSVYGAYDNGFHVFPLYDNFAGTSLNTSEWTVTGNATLNNGITFTSTPTNNTDYITSRMVLAPPAYVETYGIMNSPALSNQTTYFLGGVGFGNGGISGTQPVFTNGWAENDTNALGFSLWNGNGIPYTYNFSKSADPYVYNVFGTGFINGTYSVATINYTLQNESRFPLSSPPGGLNAVLGFQALNFPSQNHFYWIFAVSALPGGINLPFTFGSQTVSFNVTGYPVSSSWELKVNNGTVNDEMGIFNFGNASVVLPNGTYNYSVSSAIPTLVPLHHTGKLVLDGSNTSVKVAFIPYTSTVTMHAMNLPSGTSWTVDVNGESYNSTTSTINLYLINGTYSVNISAANGYEAYPSSGSFVVSGYSFALNVSFESTHNQSYIRASSTLFTTQPPISGFAGPVSNTYSGTSIAVDNARQLLFSASVSSGNSGNITVQNITTGKFLANITVGEGIPPTSIYFDQSSGYLYVAFLSGNLSIINVKTMSLVKNVSLPLLNNWIIIQNSPDSADIYVESLSNSYYASGYNYTVYTISASGSILSVKTFENQNSLFGGPLGSFDPVSPVFHNLVVIGNVSGVFVLNLSSGLETFYPAPGNYSVNAVIQYGNPGNYLLGNLPFSGSNYSSNLIFNLSSRTYVKGPQIPGQAIAGIYDPQTGFEYIQTYGGGIYNPAPTISAIFVVNPSNNSILASAPAITPGMQLALDMKTSTLYSLDFYVFESDIHAYRLGIPYNVTVSEHGLPAGSHWYVNITGMKPSGPLSPGSSFTVRLLNGNYSLHYETTDKLYLGGFFTFSVDNGPYIAGVTFGLMNYTISFQQSGLSPAALWYVNITGTNGLNEHKSALAPDMGFLLDNGTYSYTVATSDKKYQPSGGGTFTVNGASDIISVKFTLLKYSVEFAEKGLPGGKHWNVTVNSVTYKGTGEDINVSLANGTYSYSVGNVSGYSISNGTGNIVVSGGSAHVSVQFTAEKSNTGGAPLSTTDYIVIGVVIAAAAGGAAVLLMRRRGGSSQ